MGPVLWIAQFLGKKTVLQEQNSFPGLTTRKLAPKAKAICLGFESAKDKLNSSKTFYTGNPLRSSFQQSQRDDAMKVWGFDSSRKTILITGGSLGAQSINYAVAECLPSLLPTYNVIWQTGKTGIPDIADAKLILNASRDREKSLVVLPFIENVADAYAVADLAVCRAGALTLAELAIVALPAILVPYPFAADDHQTANAMSLVNGGAAYLIADKDLDGNILLNCIASFFNNEATQNKMTDSMKNFAKPQAASDIAEIAFDVIEGK